MTPPTVYTIPARRGRLSKGWYVARRKKWLPHASFIIVMVIYDDDKLMVYEPGSEASSPVKEWDIRDRILGLKEATAFHAASVLGSRAF